MLFLKQETEPFFFSFNQQEHFCDHQSGSGYLAWRLKTVQRSSAQEIKKSKSTFQDGPKTHRNMHSIVRQLSGNECKEAMSMMRHSADITFVKDKMKATFPHRQRVVQDPATASTVLDPSPRFHLMIHYPSCIRNMWCIRFEGKHNFYKKSVKNFKNITKTLVKKHQNQLAFHFENFYFKRLQFGPVTEVLVSSLRGQ